MNIITLCMVAWDYLKNVALCLYNSIMFYLGTSHMHPGGGYMSIPLSQCEDTPKTLSSLPVKFRSLMWMGSTPSVQHPWVAMDPWKGFLYKKTTISPMSRWLCIYRNVVGLSAMLPAKSPGEWYVCMHLSLCHMPTSNMYALHPFNSYSNLYLPIKWFVQTYSTETAAIGSSIIVLSLIVLQLR